jgi:O-antigen ligase
MTTIINPITFLLATLCMQWVALGSLGAFSVKLPYVALAMVIPYAMSGPRKFSYSILAARRNLLWMVPIALYLVTMGLIQANSPAANSAPRQLFYLVASLALMGSIAAAPRLSRTLRFGSAIGLVLLIVAVEVLARSVGLSWTRAITEFLRGNLNFVVYSFFREVFNAVNVAGDPQGASIKNEVAVGVLVLALLFRSAKKQASSDIAGLAVMALALGLLLLLNTRSVIIAAALALVIAIVVGAAISPQRNVAALTLKGAAALALALVAVQQALPADAVSGLLSDRFAFDDESTSARLDQFSTALTKIEQHPLTGNGYVEVDGHVIHNLFLSAWVQGGVGPFLLVLTFYCALFGSWVFFLWRTVKRPRHWKLPIAPEWLAPLPILPLSRVWSSGDGGNMYLGEWVAISCFFGCCLANELKRRRVAGVAQQYWKALVAMRDSSALPAAR